MSNEQQQEWQDEIAGEIIDESTLTAILRGEYFPRNKPEFIRLPNGDIEITMEQGGYTNPEKRVSTIFTRMS